MSFISAVTLPPVAQISESSFAHFLEASLHILDTFSPPPQQQKPGSLWNNFLGLITSVLLSSSHAEATSSRNNSMSFFEPREILHLGNLTLVQRVAAQEAAARAKEEEGEDGEPAREQSTTTTREETQHQQLLVAKFINSKLWQKVTAGGSDGEHKTTLLLGKDRLQVEKHFVSEILATMCASRSNAATVPRILALGAFVQEDDNDENSETTLMCPCFFVENFDCSLRDLMMYIVTEKNRRRGPDDDDGRGEKEAAALLRLIAAQLRKQLSSVILFEDKKKADWIKMPHYDFVRVRLAGHIDICPSNILVRCRPDDESSTHDDDVDEEQQQQYFPFEFALADWGCAAWATDVCLCGKENKKSNNEAAAAAETDRVRGGHISRYGTPPFADDSLLAIHQSFFDLQGEEEATTTTTTTTSNDSVPRGLVRCSACNSLSVAASAVASGDAFSFTAVCDWVVNASGGGRGGGEPKLTEDDDDDDDVVASSRASSLALKMGTLIDKLL